MQWLLRMGMSLESSGIKKASVARFEGVRESVIRCAKKVGFHEGCQKL